MFQIGLRMFVMKAAAVAGQTAARVEHIAVQEQGITDLKVVFVPVKTPFATGQFCEQFQKLGMAIMISRDKANLGFTRLLEQFLQPVDGGGQGQIMATAYTPAEVEDITPQYNALIAGGNLSQLLWDHASRATRAEQMQIGYKNAAAYGRSFAVG
jgi:hypothetical protein